MFLGGSGGTGKSRVIQAFVDFSRRWQATTSTVITASSGVAAVLIGGCTIHSALGITKSMKPVDPSPSMIQAWSEIGIMLIDEFGMVKADLYDLMDSRLRKLKGCPDKPFGGVHMIYCGDFYQLPPVGSSLFVAPTRREDSLNNNSLACMRGRDKWLNLTTDVIELVENHRQTDSSWAESQERWRLNQPNKKDIDDVNSRFLESFSTSSEMRPPKGTIAAVPENATRENGIRYCESQFLTSLPPILSQQSEWRERGLILVQAKVARTEGHQPIQKEQRDYAGRIASTKMKTVNNLLCTIGAPYMVGTNIDVSKGIANGTIAKFYDIVLVPNAQVRIVTLEDGNQAHAVYADEVNCLILKHTAPAQEKIGSFPNLPLGCFPVTAIKCNIICKLGSTGKNFKVRVTQLPCVSALVLTGHKIQGQTLNSVILGALSPVHQSGQSGWIYVVLSRVRKLEGLFLLTKLEEDPRKYLPRKNVMKEMDRLRIIERSTIARISIIQ